jgi:hydrogenase maturation factor HypE
MEQERKGGDEMLFRKKIERCCAYCQYAGKIDEQSMVCQRSGIVPAGHACRRFRYDPLKRVPARRKPKDFEKLDQKDFTL